VGLLKKEVMVGGIMVRSHNLCALTLWHVNYVGQSTIAKCQSLQP